MQQINDIGAAGLSPPCDSAAEGVAASISGTHYHKSRGDKWSAKTFANVREWAAAGLSTHDVAKRLSTPPGVVRYRATLLGIKFNPLGAVAQAFKKAESVLREHYGGNTDSSEVYRMYTHVLGWQCSKKSMHHHAHRIGVTRGAEALASRTRRMMEARVASQAEARVVRAVQVQALLDTGMFRHQAAAALGFGEKAVHRMLVDGLITEPPRPVKNKHVRVVRIKPVRVVIVKPPKPRPPMVYKSPEPAKPGAVYQTVDAWLAAGNVVTRCPTAILVLGQATIPEEDRVALRAYHDARDAVKYAAGDAWRQRGHKKSKQKEMTT